MYLTDWSQSSSCCESSITYPLRPCKYVNIGFENVLHGFQSFLIDGHLLLVWRLPYLAKLFVVASWVWAMLAHCFAQFLVDPYTLITPTPKIDVKTVCKDAFHSVFWSPSFIFIYAAAFPLAFYLGSLIMLDICSWWPNHIVPGPTFSPDTVFTNHSQERSKFVLFFNSPEHNVLKGSFKDHPVSVFRRPSCVVNNLFKHQILLNRWANLNQTWQECSLGGPL